VRSRIQLPQGPAEPETLVAIGGQPGPVACREQEAFAHLVNHDLRAPLRHVEGFAALLASHLESRPGALDAKGRHYLERILGASRAMDSLLEDLAGYTRLGCRELQCASVDLDRAIASLRQEFRSGPAWDVADLGKVKGDPQQLRLAFRHLFGNAEKFGRSGPDARIWARRAGVREGRIIFEVGDDGVGFDPAYADHLFGVFQRLHPRADFPGNGIGLALVARIIRRHGGEIWAESMPGAGARFFLTLEASEEGA
jgi:light-regulated signal transduction histidine kinase (bacteriophytochrome)